MAVRTEDADCLLSPRIEAIPSGVAITEKLFDAGWRLKEDAPWVKAGDKATGTRCIPNRGSEVDADALKPFVAEVMKSSP